MQSRFLLAFPVILCSIAAIHGESLSVLKPRIARYSYEAIPKDPLASALFSVTLPGTGQLYNREYGRALALGLPFWSGLVVTRVMIRQWEIMNTDTFYLRETNAIGTEDRGARMVIAPRQDRDLVGLAPMQKAALAAAAGVCGISWVWGIIDAWQGANRYNQRLVVAGARRPEIDVGLNPAGAEIIARLSFTF